MSSLPISPVCVPDAYLTDERLDVLFNEFKACLSHNVPRSSTFAHLVNSIRELYVAQILILSRPLPESEPNTQSVDQPTMQHRQYVTARYGQYTPNKWVIGIDVVYGEQGSQCPANRIQELMHSSDEINEGHDGKLVWLVPRFSTNHTSALTGIRIAIQGAPDEDKCSLARGASGFYRYIVPESVPGERRIYEVCLLRLSRAVKGAPVGYDGCSIDINCGRTGGYLYLIWKSCCI
ncbi:hypothetical protein Q9L58_001454 [Maublancomyces gigas]|uniref:Uncharacterized protein n=1 Tax=Discina gigas TaxID=1032678 RepID=A0ABR3GU00_9PEZI